MNKLFDNIDQYVDGTNYYKFDVVAGIFNIVVCFNIRIKTNSRFKKIMLIVLKPTFKKKT